MNLCYLSVFSISSMNFVMIIPGVTFWMVIDTQYFYNIYNCHEVKQSNRSNRRRKRWQELVLSLLRRGAGLLPLTYEDARINKN